MCGNKPFIGKRHTYACATVAVTAELLAGAGINAKLGGRVPRLAANVTSYGAGSDFDSDRGAGVLNIFPTVHLISCLRACRVACAELSLHSIVALKVQVRIY